MNKRERINYTYLSRYDYDKELSRRTWKNFIRYKVMELGILPLSALALWKIPLWVGFGFIKLFNIDAGNVSGYCNKVSSTLTECNGTINYTDVYISGLAIIILTSGFIALNYLYANENAQKDMISEHMRKKKDE